MGDLYLDSKDAFPPLQEDAPEPAKKEEHGLFCFFFLENANLQEKRFLPVKLLMQHLSSFHEGSFIHLEVA